MLRDCKYRLPCAWCDKYDRECLAVQYEVSKQERERREEDNSVPIEECKHNWVVEKAEAVTKEETGCTTYYTQRCSICGAKRLKKVEVDGSQKFNVTIYRYET